jgi:hypothetical protein
MDGWLYWSVPKKRVSHYLFVMWIAIFILPILFGLKLTTLGYLLNVVWLDFIYYIGYKRSQELKNKHKDDDGNDTF